MDNAKYHRTRQPYTPIPSKLRKTEIITYLSNAGFHFNPESYKSELARVLRQWIEEIVLIQVKLLARNCGHEIVWSPPCFSDLNPI